MPVLSKLLRGLSSHLLLLPLVLIGSVSLAGCGANPLSLLTGGGPNVAANTQIGKENSQAVAGQITRTEAGRDINTSRVQADSVEEVNIQEIPPWVILLLILGWLLPSPGEIARWITNLFKRNDTNG